MLLSVLSSLQMTQTKGLLLESGPCYATSAKVTECYGDLSSSDGTRARRLALKQLLGSRQFLLREFMDTSVARYL